MLHFDFYLIKKDALEKAEQLEKQLLVLAEEKEGLNIDFIQENPNFLLEIQPFLRTGDMYDFYQLATYYPDQNQTELLLNQLTNIEEWYQKLEENKDKYIILKRLGVRQEIVNGEKRIYESDSDNQTYSLNDFLTTQIHLDDDTTQIILSSAKQEISDSFLETASDRMNHLLNGVSDFKGGNWKTLVISSKESLDIRDEVKEILQCENEIEEEFILQQLLDFYHVKTVEYSNKDGELPVFYCKLTPKQIAVEANTRRIIVDDEGNPIWRWTDDEFVHSKDLLTLILENSNNSAFKFELLTKKQFKRFDVKKFKHYLSQSCELSKAPAILTSIPFDVLINNQDDSLKDFDTRQSIELDVKGIGHIMALEYDENIDPLNNYQEI